MDEFAAPDGETKAGGTNVLAIVSLILGILSFILNCCCGWCAIPLAIGGIITGVLGMGRANKDGDGTSKILSIIGMALSGLALLIFAVFMILNCMGQSVMGSSGGDPGEFLEIIEDIVDELD